MPAELPDRVNPANGASTVDFPWGAAATAINAINAAVSTLSTQLDQRPGMNATLSQWEGRFRDEFDGAYSRISGNASGVKETLTTLASNIVSGAADANQEQSRRNQQAAEPDNDAPTTTTNRRGPI